jgi:hypothetical protein
MAKKKLSTPPVSTDTYYAYYDKNTNALLSVTNEKLSLYTDYLEIDFDTYEKLVTGKEKFSEYLLGNIKTEGKTSLVLMPKIKHAYYFKNTLLEFITEPPTRQTELTVEWNTSKKEWLFFLSKDAELRLRSKIANSKLLFFIILESDYDFLIRTIDIDANELCSTLCVGIPFNSKIEQSIDKISVSTKLTFESYGLRIKSE